MIKIIIIITVSIIISVLSIIDANNNQAKVYKKAIIRDTIIRLTIIKLRYTKSNH